MKPSGCSSVPSSAADAADLYAYLSREQGVRRVVAMCNPENVDSWRLLERLGFSRESHLRQNVFFRRDGMISLSGRTHTNTVCCARNGAILCRVERLAD